MPLIDACKKPALLRFVPPAILSAPTPVLCVVLTVMPASLIPVESSVNHVVLGTSRMTLSAIACTTRLAL